jgi:integrase
MQIYKRGKNGFYWFRFKFDGQLICESTKQKSFKVAKDIATDRQSRLAKERDGRNEALARLQCRSVERCPECSAWFDPRHCTKSDEGKYFCSQHCAQVWNKKHRVIPTLKDFIDTKLESWAKSTFEKTVPNNWYWYRAGFVVIRKHNELGSLPLDAISDAALVPFVSKQLADGYAIATVNSTLRIIRAILHKAASDDYKLLDKAPEIKLLKGEHRREHVVTPEEEKQYLAIAEREDPEIGHAIICLLDTGLRPDEFYRLRWEYINWKCGTLLVTHGKTEAARRKLNLSPRLRFILETRWEQAKKPVEGWVWPSATKSGHFEQSTIKKRHSRILRLCQKEAEEQKKKKNGKPVVVRPFIPYALRHTFLTRLGESGCDVWTHARIAGHSNIEMSSRYVHPSEQAVTAAQQKAIERGYENETNQVSASVRSAAQSAVNGESAEVNWRARRDSNSRPIAPEAIALSS